jgi:hypothetical protein
MTSIEDKCRYISEKLNGTPPEYDIDEIRDTIYDIANAVRGCTTPCMWMINFRDQLINILERYEDE